MPNNTRATETDVLYRFLHCDYCRMRFQLPRRGIAGGALAAANRLTGTVNRHEAECPKRTWPWCAGCKRRVRTATQADGARPTFLLCVYCLRERKS